MGEEGESGREGIKDAKEQIYYCSAAMKRDLDERRKKVETRACAIEGEGTSERARGSVALC